MRTVVRILLALACALASSTLVTPADAAYRYTAPRTLRAAAATTSTLSLRWTAPRGAKAFQVQYAASSSMRGAKYVRTSKASGVLRSLKPATRYWFRVRVMKPGSRTALSAFTKKAYPSARTASPAAPPVVTTPPPPPPIVWPTTTPAPAASTGGPADVRVASFNLFGVNNDASASADQPTWRARRPVVVSQVLRQQADVVGLQEANQSTTYAADLDYGQTQYDDLVGALGAAGGHYAVTNQSPYNCQKATSSTGCVPLYRGASNGHTDPLQHRHGRAGRAGLHALHRAGRGQDRPLPRLGRVPRPRHRRTSSCSPTRTSTPTTSTCASPSGAS